MGVVCGRPLDRAPHHTPDVKVAMLFVSDAVAERTATCLFNQEFFHQFIIYTQQLPQRIFDS